MPPSHCDWSSPPSDGATEMTSESSWGSVDCSVASMGTAVSSATLSFLYVPQHRWDNSEHWVSQTPLQQNFAKGHTWTHFFAGQQLWAAWIWGGSSWWKHEEVGACRATELLCSACLLSAQCTSPFGGCSSMPLNNACVHACVCICWRQGLTM